MTPVEKDISVRASDDIPFATFRLYDELLKHRIRCKTRALNDEFGYHDRGRTGVCESEFRERHDRSLRCERIRGLLSGRNRESSRGAGRDCCAVYLDVIPCTTNGTCRIVGGVQLAIHERIRLRD